MCGNRVPGRNQRAIWPALFVWQRGTAGWIQHRPGNGSRFGLRKPGRLCAAPAGSARSVDRPKRIARLSRPCRVIGFSGNRTLYPGGIGTRLDRAPGHTRGGCNGRSSSSWRARWQRCGRTSAGKNSRNPYPGRTFPDSAKRRIPFISRSNRGSVPGTYFRWRRDARPHVRSEN